MPTRQTLFLQSRKLPVSQVRLLTDPMSLRVHTGLTCYPSVAQLTDCSTDTDNADSERSQCVNQSPDVKSLTTDSQSNSADPDSDSVL